ncbi:hypothetical protein EMIHUDRAFT_237928 [Emiliania huxleyi CCMP1516]|uniref:CBM1 domain-containing protein n=2 Tax=Emiliania huxleyi TaxID=2903 RepID=A0A0D3JP53_EMIH1|nr:hypothetical protein EMIHUDRAFT_237928 [Emiliania huxleyi CCMP1516]EOD25288.1 hypothetical protein EMIHUDRAFT_237928 [Emiliania huxleyi CCMP1516]|eukprot:XP_005777717.1 hypothetical protein EMIHUDRAFT_237928 [Emiliania huxleyi CCMP1516]
MSPGWCNMASHCYATCKPWMTRCSAPEPTVPPCSSNAVETWGKCSYSGQCCSSADECFIKTVFKPYAKNSYYAQCRPSCPANNDPIWACASGRVAPSREEFEKDYPGLTWHAQCGGVGFSTDPLACQEGLGCYQRNEYYWQCLEAPAGACQSFDEASERATLSDIIKVPESNIRVALRGCSTSGRRQMQSSDSDTTPEAVISAAQNSDHIALNEPGGSCTDHCASLGTTCADETPNNPPLPADEWPKTVWPTTEAQMEAISDAWGLGCTAYVDRVLILDGNSDTEACVHDAEATTHGGTAIAAQCCDGSTCKRRTSGSNDDCIAGLWSSSFQYTTFQEASARCAALGYTLCDKNCQGTGCSYDSIWACVHDAEATTHGGTAIAAQCCDGSTCKRRTSGSNDDCIAGLWSSSFQYTTFQEASARCAALGYTLCDKNCQGTGCSYDSIWGGSCTDHCASLGTTCADETPNNPPLPADEWPKTVWPTTEAQMEAISDAWGLGCTTYVDRVLILDGNSDTEACVHDAEATTHGGTAIAAQCCDGSTCKRRTSGSNDDCIAGLWSSSFQYTTFQEASARCAALGYTLCDKNCQGTGCSYDSIWACVHDAEATTHGGTAIAAQCCDGSTCKRRTSGSNDDCIAGLWSSSFQYTTFQEASARCAALGYTLCDKNCQGTGCSYDSIWGGSCTDHCASLGTTCADETPNNPPLPADEWPKTVWPTTEAQMEAISDAWGLGCTTYVDRPDLYVRVDPPEGSTCEWCGKQDSGFGSSLGLDGSGGRAGQVWTSPGGITYTSNPWLSCGLTSGFIYGPEGFPVAATLTYAIEKCSQLSISSGRECIGLRYTMDLNSVRQQYLGCYGLYTDSQSMRGADDDPEYFIIPGSR